MKDALRKCWTAQRNLQYPSGFHWLVWLLRHGIVVALSALLVWLFVALRNGIHEVHQWNRAFADVSLFLLVAALSLGPLARVWRQLSPALPFRRELGIWCVVLAVVHVAYYAQGAFDWQFHRFVYGTPHQTAHGLQFEEAWRRDAWAAANWVGAAAFLYAAIPFATSNDLSQRILGKMWIRAQSLSSAFLALSLTHVFLFLFVVYVNDPASALAGGLFWFSLATLVLVRAVGGWVRWRAG